MSKLKREELRYLFEEYGHTKLFRDTFCPTTCPLCRRFMNYGLGRNRSGRELGPSIDRIIPEHGYRAWNILVICTECNSAKWSREYVAGWSGMTPIFTDAAKKKAVWIDYYTSAIAATQNVELYRISEEYRALNDFS